MTGSDELLAGVLYRFADAEGVRKRQRGLVGLFADLPAGSVLDLGCGRGIFLELLREQGVSAVGVDGHPDSVARCRELGFEAHRSGVLEFLRERAQRGETHAGIFCSHLIEHLPGDAAMELIALCAKVLAPRGRLVLVTPNVRNLFTWQNTFWLDPTHVRPYPRKLMEALLETAGLEVLRSFDDPNTKRYRGAAAVAMFVPNLVRYGVSGNDGQDSVVLARRPG